MEELYDWYKDQRDALEIEVEQKSNIVTQTGKGLERLNGLADAFVIGSENDPIRQILQVEERVRLFREKRRPTQIASPGW